MVHLLLKIVHYICHLQGDIEALTLQEHSLDEQIRLVTSYLSSCCCYSFTKHATPMFLAVICERS